MFPFNFFPFNKDMKNKLQHMKSDEIDQFIKGILGNVMSSQSGSAMNPQDFVNHFRPQPSQQVNSQNSTAFETHDSVFVRIPIKDESLLKDLRIYHTANQLTVENIPELDQKHSITLPAAVKRKGSSAKFKDGILEIKLIKSHDIHYSQIDVTEI
ncbi:Hsp20/alpha crystallin family protein [Neobacillus niacini]|nr:Hsp20/alpha crystallin family protein [Neobacillus niacini]MEC1521337.1 Hsp20/alpha crystallin family protein [Neobacillus niacini]